MADQPDMNKAIRDVETLLQALDDQKSTSDFCKDFPEGATYLQSILENFVKIAKSVETAEATARVLDKALIAVPGAAAALNLFVIPLLESWKNCIDLQKAIHELFKRLVRLLEQLNEVIKIAKSKENGHNDVIVYQIEIERFFSKFEECITKVNETVEARSQPGFCSCRRRLWNAKADLDKIDGINAGIDTFLLEAIALNSLKFGVKTEDMHAKLCRDPIEMLKRFKTDRKDLDGVFMKDTREWIFQEFEEWINATDSDNRGRALIIAAPPGFGKSVLAHQLVKRYGSQKNGNKDIACHFFQSSYEQRNNPSNMFLSLCYQLAGFDVSYATKLKDALKDVSEERLDRYGVYDIFEEFLVEPLKDLSIDKPRVIVIDALDECREEDKNNFLSCLKDLLDKLPQWLKVFMTTRPEYPLMDKLQNYKPKLIQFETHGQKPSHDLEQNKKDIENYIQKHMGKFPDIDEDRALSTLWDKCGGNFLLAKNLTNLLDNENKVTIDTIERLPSSLADVYERHFEKIIRNGWRDSDEKKILELIVSACDPMTLQTIAQLIDCEWAWNGMNDSLQRLSQFLSFSSSDWQPDTTVSVFHKSFTDWLFDNDENKRFLLDPKSAHKSVAGGCLKYLDKKEIACSQAEHIGKYTRILGIDDYTGSKYVLKYAIYHLEKAGMILQAQNVIQCVGWLIAKTYIGNTYEIELDCRKVDQNDHVVYLIGRAAALAVLAVQKDRRYFPEKLVGHLYGAPQVLSGKHKERLESLLERIRSFSYGYDWWCPVQPYKKQAHELFLRGTGVFEDYEKHQIRWLTFSPDSRYVASFHVNRNDDDFVGRLSVWDVDSCSIAPNPFKRSNFVDTRCKNLERVEGVWIQERLILVFVFIPYHGRLHEVWYWEGNEENEVSQETQGPRLVASIDKYLEGIKLSPDGRKLASLEVNGLWRAWNIDSTGSEEYTLPAYVEQHHWDFIDWSRCSKRFLSANREATVYIWSLTEKNEFQWDKELQLEKDNPDYDIRRNRWHPDPTAKKEGTVRIWSLTEQLRLEEDDDDKYELVGVRWHPDPTCPSIFISTNQYIKLIRIEDGEYMNDTFYFQKPKGFRLFQPDLFCPLNDGTRVVFRGEDSSNRGRGESSYLTTCIKGEKDSTLWRIPYGVRVVCSPDGMKLASLDEIDGSKVMLWDASPPAPTFPSEEETASPSSVNGDVCNFPKEVIFRPNHWKMPLNDVLGIFYVRWSKHNELRLFIHVCYRCDFEEVPVLIWNADNGKYLGKQIYLSEEVQEMATCNPIETSATNALEPFEIEDQNLTQTWLCHKDQGVLLTFIGQRPAYFFQLIHQYSL